MNRLTGRYADGKVYVIAISGNRIILHPGKGWPTNPTIVEKLAAYEDTGLEPEEIAEMKILWGMYGGSDGITDIIADKTPCDMCRFSPPSSGDGKPCCICPAEVRR